MENFNRILYITSSIIIIMEPNSHHSSRPPDSFSDPQLIVEERIVKVNGEISVRKYTKGKFIGKVLNYAGWLR